MNKVAIGLFLLASGAAVRADDFGWLDPQAKGAAAKGGFRAWANTELFGGELEAANASGNDPLFDSESDFNSDVDAWLVQASAWLNAGYELNFGLTIYGKVGFIFPTLVEDIDQASPVSGINDERHDVVVDRMIAYGLGLGFRRQFGTSVVGLARLEYTLGSGDVNNSTYHTVFGDGDYDYSRLEVRAAVGFLTDLGIPYLGVRYNMLEAKLDHSEIGGTDTFDVEYELDTPIGVFLGITERLGERVRWSIEVGLLDAFTFEVGAGLAF